MDTDSNALGGPLLEVKDLRTWFFTRSGTGKAVDGVSFTLNEGESLGLLGESGCGKSITSLSLLRLVPRPAGRIVSGEVLFQGPGPAEDLGAGDAPGPGQADRHDSARPPEHPQSGLLHRQPGGGAAPGPRHRATVRHLGAGREAPEPRAHTRAGIPVEGLSPISSAAACAKGSSAPRPSPPGQRSSSPMSPPLPWTSPYRPSTCGC